jgi:glutamyl-tRNA reductase
MAELAVEHLHRHHSGHIYVANRTFERGLSMAAAYQGTAIRFDEIRDHIDKVDIIIGSTGAPNLVITRDMVKRIMRSRRNRPIFFIDIAVPRDIDPDINSLNNAYVYDIDDLKEVVDENKEDRRREAAKAERIIDEAVLQFERWYQGLGVVPTIKALRAKMEALARGELDKTLPSLTRLTPEDRQAIEKMVQATINKMLHDPTRYLKSDGCLGDRSASVDVARKLFGLDEH